MVHPHTDEEGRAYGLMDALNVVRRRLVEQRLTGEPFDDVAAAVGWLGAVQAQEFAEAKWSMAERTHDTVDRDVEAAVARGDIIRTHVLRPPWHFVARDDLRWLLRLTRPRVHARNRYWYRKFELGADVLTRSSDVFARLLAGGEPRTRRELATGLAEAGIHADGLRLGYALMHAELEELICSGPRRGRQHTYVLVDRRVPGSALDRLSREEALAELALRYFRSHGPATLRDFTAWSSLTVADVREAVERLGGALASEDDGTGTRWYAGATPTGEPADPRPRAFLIPMYDETIVAYQDLRVVLAHHPPRGGLLERAIVIDGRTYGTWKRTVGARSVTVVATAFGPLTAPQLDELERTVQRFGQFLGRSASLEVRYGL